MTTRGVTGDDTNIFLRNTHIDTTEDFTGSTRNLKLHLLSVQDSNTGTDTRSGHIPTHDSSVFVLSSMTRERYTFNVLFHSNSVPLHGLFSLSTEEDVSFPNRSCVVTLVTSTVTNKDLDVLGLKTDYLKDDSTDTNYTGPSQPVLYSGVFLDKHTATRTHIYNSSLLSILLTTTEVHFTDP